MPPKGVVALAASRQVSVGDFFPGSEDSTFIGLHTEHFHRSILSSLPQHHRPELHRTSLEHVVLQMFAMDLVRNSSIEAVMNETVEPPPVESVRAGIFHSESGFV
jgi:hypothetical protein